MNNLHFTHLFISSAHLAQAVLIDPSLFGAVILLVEKASTSPSTTVTVQLVAGIFDGKFIVIGKLFTTVDLPQRKYDYVLLAFHVNNPRVTVRLTRVVNKTRCVAVHGGVYYVEVVDAEHVAADVLEGATERAR